MTVPHPLLAQLTDERRRRGLSQTALAERAGVGVSSVQAWEAGALPTLAALQPVLDALGLRVVAIPAAAPTPVYGPQLPLGQLTVGDGEKWCPDCRKVLPVAEFTRDRRRRDGLCWRCRSCTAERHQRRKQRRGPRTEAGAA